VKRSLNELALCALSVMLAACSDTETDSSFDYEKLIPLDAESLCESGIESAYDSIMPTLTKIIEPREVKRVETANDDYIIKFNEQVFPVYIYASDMNVEGCWENATKIFFHIVNEQLKSSEQKLYAFYSGNDLFGGFLTTSEVSTIKTENPNSEYEWPYLPTYTEIKK